jgi:hypothetical protein
MEVACSAETLIKLLLYWWRNLVLSKSLQKLYIGNGNIRLFVNFFPEEMVEYPQETQSLL